MTEKYPSEPRHFGLGKFISSLSIEPAFFIISFSYYMEKLVLDQLITYKICRVDFNYTETVCNDLGNVNYTDQNNDVSQAYSDFAFIALCMKNIFPTFFAFYLGAWADRFGRKPIFYLFLSATVMSQSIIVICSVYLDTPKEYIFLSYIPSTLAGKLHQTAWKSLKMSHLNFSMLAFSTNFCSIKSDLSGNTVWPQTSVFSKTRKIDYFWHS